MPASRYVGRFAPSPTGPLHLGSLLAALGSWLLARHSGGDWLIRVEDLDPPREIPGAAEHQLRTLAAFGLESDRPALRQSERSEHYATALQRLLDSGAAFECRCSRTELQAFSGIHRRCIGFDPKRNPAIRLRVPDIELAFEDTLRGRFRQRLGAEVGDVVLKRADGYWAYQLAVVVDDAAQGITDVVRGADLLDSTPRQIYLQRQLGLATPRYAHLPLLLDKKGDKLSKSVASAALDRNDPIPALQRVWQALGQSVQPIQGPTQVREWLNRARDLFQPDRIPHQDLELSTLIGFEAEVSP
jgi:glutamyl-Q tRNA(Asp) synthetase